MGRCEELIPQKKIVHLKISIMKSTEYINDLIEINNDRIEGYEKASKQAEDEDAAQQAYDSALKEDDITGDTRLVVENQKKSLHEAHNRMKDLRDAEPTA